LFYFVYLNDICGYFLFICGQCELLEILMIYLKDFEIDTDKAIQLMEMFKVSINN